MSSTENTEDGDLLQSIAYDTTRERGILTEKDREYLLGNLDLDDQSEYNLKYRLRNRLKNSLLDFPILNELSDEEFQKVLATVPHYDSSVAEGDQNDLPVTLLYYLCDFVTSYAYNEDEVANPIEALENEISRTVLIQEVNRRGDPHLSATTNIDVSQIQTNTYQLYADILASYDRPSRLTQETIDEFTENATPQLFKDLVDKLEKTDNERAKRLSEYLKRYRNQLSSSDL